MYVKYPINLTTSLNSELRITTRDIHLVAYDKTWHSTIHQHPFTEIFYCLSGTGHIWIDSQELPIQKNSLVIINPHTPHTEFSNKKHPLEYIVIGVQGIHLSSRTSKKSSLYHIMEDSFHIYSKYFKEIISELEESNIYANEIIHCIINVILLKLKHNIVYLSVSPESNHELSTPVYNAKLYIDNNLSTDINLDTLEAVTHTSKYHLSRLFKSEMDMTIVEYTTQTRLARSEDLLISTNYTVNQIASMTGFNTASYFASKFKSLYGCSPREFRQRKSLTD